MSIMELGALGEFVGAIAVVVTLIYLALQIRQNTDTVKDSNMRSQTDRFIGHSRFVVATPGFTSVFRRGCEDLSKLDDDERWMFGTFMYSMFQGFQETYHLHQKSRTEAFNWNSLKDAMMVYLGRPGGKEWWLGISKRQMLDESFAVYVNGLIDEGQT
jgi:hypothetical protein